MIYIPIAFAYNYIFVIYFWQGNDGVKIMTKKQTTIRLSGYQREQIETLTEWGVGSSTSEVLTLALDRLHQQEASLRVGAGITQLVNTISQGQVVILSLDVYDELIQKSTPQKNGSNPVP
ncbi:hypothetical protein MNBD_CHLOROFLEXI01-4672 [hydrothermal vent metagenome]|uniref:Uncharacterized protein n=1 Tax=hydrothermal vent metagenome TaxID=652676 RepID=A0A3B0UMY3_9ZZZZ